MYSVAILAGGLGSRMRSITGDRLPKVLLPVAGRPFIDYKLAGLAAQGVEHAVLLLAHGSDEIVEHVGNGTNFGIQISVVREATPLGTGGAVANALPELGDTFWVTYGDTYLRLDMVRAEREYVAARREGLMTVLHNQDQWDKSNVDVENNLVVNYQKNSQRGAHDYIDYGMAILRAQSFRLLNLKGPFDLEDVFLDLVRRGQLMAFEVEKRFYEIGSPVGLAETEAFFRTTE